MDWQLTETGIDISRETDTISVPYDQVKRVHLNKVLEKAGKYSVRKVYTMKISDGDREFTISVRSDEPTSDFDKLQKGLHAKLVPFKKDIEFTKGQEGEEQRSKVKAMLWLLVVPVILISISIGFFLVTHDHWSGALLFVLAAVLMRYLNNALSKNKFGNYDPERIPSYYIA